MEQNSWKRIMEQGYAKPRTVGRWGWGIRVKKRRGEGNNGLCGKRGRIGNCHKRNLCSEQLIGTRCILANVSSNGETTLKIFKCNKFLHDLTMQTLLCFLLLFFFLGGACVSPEASQNFRNVATEVRDCDDIAGN